MLQHGSLFIHMLLPPKRHMGACRILIEIRNICAQDDHGMMHYLYADSPNIQYMPAGYSDWNFRQWGTSSCLPASARGDWCTEGESAQGSRAAYPDVPRDLEISAQSEAPQYARACLDVTTDHDRSAELLQEDVDISKEHCSA